MVFRDVGEINGDLAAIAGAIGPSDFFAPLLLTLYTWISIIPIESR